MSFKVGGNFVYPPLTLNREQCEKIDRAVFVAGGVGINPIMSMISTLDLVGTKQVLGGMVKNVRVLYTSRRENGGHNEQGEEVLFEKRLKLIAQKWNNLENIDYKYTFFETSGKGSKEEPRPANMSLEYRRISKEDLLDALGPEESRSNTIIYVCGLPTMTDEFVESLKNARGMNEERVLCEKWW